MSNASGATLGAAVTQLRNHKPGVPAPKTKAYQAPGGDRMPSPGAGICLSGCEDADQAVLLVVRPGAEPDRVRSAGHGISCEQAP